MSSHEKLIERCAIRLWRYHSTSRYGHPPKRSWDDLALVEKLIYRRAAEVVMEEACSELSEISRGFDHVNHACESSSGTERRTFVSDRPTTTYVKLTAREYGVLQRLAEKPEGANVSFVSQVFLNRHPYLAKASARDCLKRLCIKGLCEAVTTRPLKYCISERGTATLEENLRIQLSD